MNKTNKIILACFLATLIFNYSYGNSFYAKMVGKEEMYRVGKQCSSSLYTCERDYFKEYVDKVNYYSTQNRDFYAGFIIKEDLLGYDGNCPCPYNTDSRGGSCGGRSSYSKSGSISYCYSRDVSDSQVSNKKIQLVAEAEDSLKSEVRPYLNIYNGKALLYLTLVFYAVIFLYFRKKGNSI